MCSYYNSYYGETTHSDGSKSYYNSYYGETSNSDGSKSYYNDYYGGTSNGDGSSSYYNSYYGETTHSDGSKSYYNNYYGGSSSYYSGSDYSGDDSGCYITTACIKAKGFSDNCFELSILRKYRDKLVDEDAEIRQVVEEYYCIAPKLVKLLDKQPDKMKIYGYIYDKLVVQSIAYLIEGDYQKAVAQYRKIYEELKEKYCT